MGWGLIPVPRVPSIFGGGIFPVVTGSGENATGGENEWCATPGRDPELAIDGNWNTKNGWTHNDSIYLGSNSIHRGFVALDSDVGDIGSITIDGEVRCALTISTSANVTWEIFVTAISNLIISAGSGTVTVNGPVSMQLAGQLQMNSGTLRCQQVACVATSGNFFVTNNPSVVMNGGTIVSTSRTAISISQLGGFVQLFGTSTIDGANQGSNGIALSMAAGAILQVGISSSTRMYGDVNLNAGSDVPGAGASATWFISETSSGSFNTSGSVQLDRATPSFTSVGGTPPSMADAYFLCSGTNFVTINEKPFRIINGVRYCTVITGTAGQGQALYWARPGNVKGSLTKGGTGQAGIAVRVTDQNGLPHDTMTDGSGNFSFYTDNDDTTWLIAPGACTWFFTPPMGATIIGPAGNPPWAFTLNPHQSKTLTGSYVGP